MRIMLTGALGFVGRHAMDDLLANGHTPLLIDRQETSNSISCEQHTVDLRNAEALSNLVATIQPDACLHLAGIAFVPIGWSDPQLVFSVNLTGTVNLVEAFRLKAPTARMLIVTSSEVYGRRPRPAPIREGDAMYPDNPYAVSKMAADYHALLYARRYGMPIMTARPDNHTGPGQSDQFVTTSFAAQLAAMANGSREPVLHVGNLMSRRNFTDVRDTVAAYRMILEQGTPGEAYNIAAKEAVTIQSILDGLCDIANIQPTIEIDPERYRPEDATPELDTTRLRALGWAPRIPLSQTLTDIYKEASQVQ